ncbi:MAG: hypothetical protein ACLTW9_05590 [Enterocloster sp.]
MADHTKFDRTSFVKYCSFQQIDILVTDRRPADEWMELLEEYQIRILYPEAGDAYIKETGNSRCPRCPCSVCFWPVAAEFFHGSLNARAGFCQIFIAACIGQAQIPLPGCSEGSSGNHGHFCLLQEILCHLHGALT